MKFLPLAMMETYVSNTETHTVTLADFAPGLHCTQHVFFKLEADGTVPWVVDRVCDHAGGTLRFSDADACKAVCPLHNWEFDFDSLSYSKIPNQMFEHITKKSIPYSVETGVLTYTVDQRSLRVPASLVQNPEHKTRAELRYISHASVMLELDGIKLVTDPWFVGECMATGWWLLQAPKDDAFALLQSADMVYISHNHPDHLHEETLQKLRRDMPFIVPKFETDAVAKPLRDMGFTNVIELEKKRLYQVAGTDMLVCILPTGDHRDDSGLFVVKGDFSAVLTVDCVGTNQYVLPENVSLLMTNFASGASGWPLCYDVVGTLEERAKIVTKNRGNALVEVLKYVKATTPQVYVPYAGYFTEMAPRDATIRAYNIKNPPQKICDAVQARYPAVRAINPLVQDMIRWQDGEVTTECLDRSPLFTYDHTMLTSYLAAQHALLKHFDIHQVASYFSQSEFKDALIVYLVLTDDDYEPLGESLRLDFSKETITYAVVDSRALLDEFTSLTELAGLHHMLLKARKDSMWSLVYYGRPLEELAIGFQCRIDRKPDQYNAAFWQHYTTYGAPMLRRGEDHLLYKLLDGAEG